MPAKRSSPLLLASVTGPEEAAIALREGADILDAKDPREGSLGACAPSVLRAIVALRDARTSGGLVAPRVSAALGDAPNLPGTFALAAAGAAACGVDYLKIGLRAPCAEDEACAFLL
ncbi:MAG: (5-formylfuran-3-yl)methyl phosphate synthase, partial [Acidobacteriota bacterium]